MSHDTCSAFTGSRSPPSWGACSQDHGIWRASTYPHTRAHTRAHTQMQFLNLGQKFLESWPPRSSSLVAGQLGFQPSTSSPGRGPARDPLCWRCPYALRQQMLWVRGSYVGSPNTAPASSCSGRTHWGAPCPALDPWCGLLRGNRGVAGTGQRLLRRTFSQRLIRFSKKSVPPHVKNGRPG